MAIQRWDPLRDLLQLQQTMNRMFEDTLARSSAGGSEDEGGAATWKPPLDLYEQEQRYVLRADLPGVLAADVEIEVEDGRLILRGQRRTDQAVTRQAYLRVERPNGPFVLQLALPPSIDAKQIRASQNNGVLEVVLPKKNEEQIPTRIQVDDGKREP